TATTIIPKLHTYKVTTGLALAAVGFAGRYAMHALQSFHKTAFGGGVYKGVLILKGFFPIDTLSELD
uniref:Uncharacterized protein n=1 Tax=Gouania willdenowi TaxID=441366 RepID=A0A8C5EDK8_GOUWI